MSLRSTRTVLCLSALAAALLLSVSLSPANEPQGLILFDTEGVKTPEEGTVGFQPGEKVVTLVIRSARRLEGAVLTHDAPGTVTQRLVSLQVSGKAARVIDPVEGKSPATIELGALAAGEPVTLAFAESYADGTGGIVSFSVEAVTADGKVFREAYGQVVGTPGTPPVIHDGLIEFPAHEVPAEEKP